MESKALEDEPRHWASGQQDGAGDKPSAGQPEYITKDDELEPISNGNSSETTSESSSRWLLRDFSDGIEGPQQRSSARPNKYHGDPDLWMQWNAEEIALCDSFLAQRDSDLSLHLHRAHVLKKRLLDPERAKNAPSWASKQSWLHSTPDGTDKKRSRSSTVYPPKRWTAWPLPADRVPREGEKVGVDEDEADEYWTFKREEEFRPSRVLEELLVGEVLKKAKERFEGRKWETPVKQEFEEPPLDHEVGENDRPIKQESYHDERGQYTKQEETDKEQSGMKSSKHSDDQKPVVMADDEEAVTLLRPSVRHILSTFNNLLTALHQSREAYLMSDNLKFKLKREKSSGSTSAPISGNEAATSLYTANEKDAIDPSHTPAVNSTENDDSTENRKSDSKAPNYRKKGKMGRPRKYGQPLPGESYWAMRRRIIKSEAAARGSGGKRNDASQSGPDVGDANNQRGEESEHHNAESEPGGVTTPDEIRNTSTHKQIVQSSTKLYHCPHPTCQQNPSKKSSFNKAFNLERHIAHFHREERTTQEPHTLPQHKDSDPRISHQQYRRQRRLDLRDWSDILSTASLIGWDEEVIARTADRCSRLFGEGIRFRSLHEENARWPRPRMVESGADMVEHIPDYIPSFEKSSVEERDRMLRNESDIPGAGVSQRISTLERQLRASAGMASASLPVRDDIQATGEGKVDGENEEGEMEGGVHVDGFLQPVPRPKSRKRKKRSRRKRQRVDEREDDVAGADTVTGAETGDDLKKEEEEGEEDGVAGKEVGVQRSLNG